MENKNDLESYRKPGSDDTQDGAATWHMCIFRNFKAVICSNFDGKRNYFERLTDGRKMP